MLLSQYQNDPSILHWEAVCHLGRYLAGTIEMGVPVSKNGGTKVTTFADSSFSDQQVRFHSSTGFTVFLGDCAVSEEGAEQRGVRSVREFSQVFQDLLRRFFRYFYYIRFRIYYTVSVV